MEKVLEKVILSYNDPVESIKYCSCNEDANIAAHEDIIVNSKSANHAINFIKSVKGANREKLEKVIIECGYYYNLIDYLTNVITVSESTKRIIEDKILEKYDLTTILDYIAKIKPANPNKINEKFIKSNIYYQYRFVCSGVDYIDFELFKEKKVFCNTEYEAYFNKLYNIWKVNQMTEEEKNVLVSNSSKESKVPSNEEVDKAVNKAIEEEIKEKTNEKVLDFFKANYPLVNLEELQKAMEYLDEKSIYGRRGEGKTNLSKEKFKETDGIEFKTISVESVKESDFTNTKPIKEEAKEDSFFKTNLEEGIYSGIAASAVDNAINIFLNSIKSSVTEQSFNAIQTMLSNDLGKSIVCMLIGSGVHFIPSDLKDNKHVAKVADKCIQNAGSKTTEFGLNFITNILLPSLLNAINGPEIKVANKFRVNSDNTDEDNVLDLMEFMQAKKAI